MSDDFAQSEQQHFEDTTEQQKMLLRYLPLACLFMAGLLVSAAAGLILPELLYPSTLTALSVVLSSILLRLSVKYQNTKLFQRLSLSLIPKVAIFECCFLFLLLLMLLSTALSAVNYLADSSTATITSVQVLNRSISTNGKHPVCTLSAVSTTNPLQKMRIAPDFFFCRDLPINDTIINLAIRSGALGFDWIESYTLQKKQRISQ